MITAADIANPARQTGYNHVQYSAHKGQNITKPYNAVVYGGTLDKAGRRWKGIMRATAEEAAQDYCDFINADGQQPTAQAKLNRAGHTRVRKHGERSTRIVVREEPKERQISGYVYCISDGTALKIGKTTNHPSNRVAELQTGNPRLLRLIACIETENVTETEAMLHLRFEHLNVLGEWFDHDDMILMEFGVMEEEDAKAQ